MKIPIISADDLFSTAIEDSRLSTSHLSLLIALFCCWQKMACTSSFIVKRSDLMRCSHISSTSTYHKCIKDLILFNYIKYEPSFDCRTGTKVSWLRDYTSEIPPVKSIDSIPHTADTSFNIDISKCGNGSKLFDSN
jgi:hypothetical protein